MTKLAHDLRRADHSAERHDSQLRRDREMDERRTGESEYRPVKLVKGDNPQRQGLLP